jgi:hypothetical protein
MTRRRHERPHGGDRSPRGFGSEPTLRKPSDESNRPADARQPSRVRRSPTSRGRSSRRLRKGRRRPAYCLDWLPIAGRGAIRASRRNRRKLGESGCRQAPAVAVAHVGRTIAKRQTRSPTVGSATRPTISFQSSSAMRRWSRPGAAGALRRGSLELGPTSARSAGRPASSRRPARCGNAVVSVHEADRCRLPQQVDGGWRP